MSEEHESGGGGGIGKVIVVAIFALMVGFYGGKLADFSGTQEGAHGNVENHHEPVAHVPKVTEADLKKVEGERDEALVQVEKLQEELKVISTRAEADNRRLGMVRDVLDVLEAEESATN